MVPRAPVKLVKEIKRLGGAALSPIVRTLRSQGYYVVPDFLPRETCAAFIAYFDEMVSQRPDKVQHDRKEGTSGDYRLFGAESESPLMKSLVADNEWLQNVAAGYLGERVVTHFVLANKVQHTPGVATNSGAGWHRDSGQRQFKAIVYLTDVDHDNGPFTFMPDSRSIEVQAREQARNEHRFDDETIARIVRDEHKSVVEVVGKAGTCVLADTSHIHRGKDIERGVRYALTNYYFEDTDKRRMKTQAKWGAHLLKPVA